MPVVYAVEFIARSNSTELPSDVEAAFSNLKCYGLPYGLFGFLSHLFTYYTLVCLWNARRPFWPFSRIEYSKLDIFLGVAGLLGTVISATITIIRCQGDWEPLLLAVWNLSMSLLNSFTQLHVVYLCWKGTQTWDVRASNPTKSAAWLALYIPGLIAGITGLTSVVRKYGGLRMTVRYLTIGFWLIVGSTLVLGIAAAITLMLVRERRIAEGKSPIVMWFVGERAKPATATYFFMKGLTYTCILFMVLGMLYSDWALAVLMDNIMGIPSADTAAISWTYWIAKRLPMLSW